MAVRIKNRQLFVPGGWKFFQPETSWNLPNNVSFDVGVQAIIAHRKGNPFLIQKHGWSIDPHQVAEELDRFNARFCEQMGWTDYIMGTPIVDAPNPHLPRPILQSLQNVADGAEPVIEFLKDPSQAVPRTLANHRAEICATCPKNGKGDFTRWFTIPLSQAIRRAVSAQNEIQLTTPSDEALNVCEACLCPLKLKVHFPIGLITKHMNPDIRKELDPRCWILHES